MTRSSTMMEWIRILDHDVPASSEGKEQALHEVTLPWCFITWTCFTKEPGKSNK